MRYTLLIVCALVALAGCQGGSPAPVGSPSPTTAGVSPADSPTSPSPQPSRLAGGGKTKIKSRKGRPWVLDAMKVVWNDSEHKARVEKVDWSLPELGGGSGVRVQANGAWFEVEKESIEFEGQVIATKANRGDRLVVSRLTWDGKKRRFVGTGGVRWTRGPMVVTGDRVTASDDLEHVELEGNVQAETVLEGDL